MKFYFSGISDEKTAKLLQEAGVTNYLADPTDFHLLPPLNRALDSGAYRAFKKGAEVNLDSYCAFLDQTSNLDFAVSPDVIGDEVISFCNWTTVNHRGYQTVPVWHHEGSSASLHYYLDNAPLVGIGGLVNAMREKDEDVLAKVATLCDQHPDRFHIFGLNWLKAMQELQYTAASCDTSKFLDAARYGHVIFLNTKTGRLSQCPSKVIPSLAPLTREERIVVSARNLRMYFEGIQQNSPFGIQA